MNIKTYAKYLAVSVSIGVIAFVFIFFFALYPLKHSKVINIYAEKYGVDSAVIASMINAESSFKSGQVSPKGAIGLMQIMPTTAQWLCEKIGKEYEYDKLFEAEYNICLGSYYFSYLMNKFGCLDTAIVAYNAGEGVVRGWLKDEKYSYDGVNLKNIPFKESGTYLKKVKTGINIYKFRV